MLRPSRRGAVLAASIALALSCSAPYAQASRPGADPDPGGGGLPWLLEDLPGLLDELPELPDLLVPDDDIPGAGVPELPGLFGLPEFPELPGLPVLPGPAGLPVAPGLGLGALISIGASGTITLL